jgi:hypothetical protein
MASDNARDLGNVRRYSGEKFHLWKFQMRAVLLGKDVMGVVDGTEPQPAATAPANTRFEWQKKDNVAISLLCDAISESYLDNVMACTTSKSIWDKLILLHEQNQSENVHSLQQAFFKCELNEGDSIATFLGQLELILSKLTARGDTTFNENAVIAKVLAKLPEGFDSVLATWEVTPAADKNLKTLTLRLLSTESGIKQRAEAQSNSVAAYVASSKGSAIGESSKKSESSSEYTQAQRAARRKEINECKQKTNCWKCGNLGHWGKECQATHEEQKAFQESQKTQKQIPSDQPKENKNQGYRAYTANFAQSIPVSGYWYVDSGCTEHMCQDRSVFSTYRDISSEQRLVEGIGGIKLQAAGVGDIVIKVWNNGTYHLGILKGVIHVPGLGRNLFSSYVAAQKKMYTLHKENGCQILENGQVIMIGVIHRRMYRLLFEAVTANSANMVTTSTVQPEIATALAASSFAPATKKESTQTLDVWHCRLAHVNHNAIRHMAASQMVDGLALERSDHKFCEGCAYGKQHRAVFHWEDPRQRSTAPGDLIHTDLCGPMSIPSIGGSRYFVLFKDDCSGFRVIECLKTKPETLASFQRFVGQLKRETGQSVKVVRSDRGTEYTNKAFTDYLAKEQIKQELTTPYTPEQNGSSERDNRTIMEASRSMLYAANVHIRFWSEAVHTAVYVLNRTATRTIDGKTPYEIWYNVKPSVSHIRIFGSDAYVHVPKELRNKLSAKSKKGVLMGYSASSKAYRVWHNDTRRIVESRDVLFDEELSTTQSASQTQEESAWLEARTLTLGDVAPARPPAPAVGAIPQQLN